MQKLESIHSFVTNGGEPATVGSARKTVQPSTNVTSVFITLADEVWVDSAANLKNPQKAQISSVLFSFNGGC